MSVVEIRVQLQHVLLHPFIDFLMRRSLIQTDNYMAYRIKKINPVLT